MENIYNYIKFTNVSRVKWAVYPLYFTGNMDAKKKIPPCQWSVNSSSFVTVARKRSVCLALILVPFQGN